MPLGGDRMGWVGGEPNPIHAPTPLATTNAEDVDKAKRITM
jgi:hypothetical protein